MAQSSHNHHTSLPEFPEGKSVEYWRNRAIRAEVELYALRGVLLHTEPELSWCQQLTNLLKGNK